MDNLHNNWNLLRSFGCTFSGFFFILAKYNSLYIWIFFFHLFFHLFLLIQEHDIASWVEWLCDDTMLGVSNYHCCHERALWLGHTIWAANKQREKECLCSRHHVNYSVSATYFERQKKSSDEYVIYMLFKATSTDIFWNAIYPSSRLRISFLYINIYLYINTQQLVQMSGLHWLLEVSSCVHIFTHFWICA